MGRFKKYLPVAIALGAPLIFIIGVIVFLTIPPLFNSPQYDFLYAEHSGAFAVNEDGRLVKNEERIEWLIERSASVHKEDDIEIWRYDIEADRLRKISFAEAQRLRLDSSPVSPDGFEIEYRGRADYSIFHEIFGSRPRVGFFIFRDNISYRLEINRLRPGAGDEILGWVISE